MSLPTRVPVKCCGCGTLFTVPRTRLWNTKPGVPLNCSKACQYAAAQVKLTCEGCGIEYTKVRSVAEKAKQNGFIRTFCTKTCFLTHESAKATERLMAASRPSVGTPASLVTDSEIRTETGRRRYYAPETAALSDGVNRRRACVSCGKIRKGTAVMCRPCYQAARASTYLTLACTQCGAEFMKMRAEHEKARRDGQTNHYCSHACASRALKSPGHPCLRCGTPTGSKDRGRRYCSKECRLAVSRAGKERACPQCGKEFHPKGSRTVYCDRVCADAAHSKRMIGEGNSRYKDGTSYAEWFRGMRPLILERDEHMCRVCETPDQMTRVKRAGGVQFRSLIVIHHINERPWDNVPENLIALCHACHMTHHKSKPTPYPWFAEYAARTTTYMTSKWMETVTSLQAKFSSTTA